MNNTFQLQDIELTELSATELSLIDGGRNLVGDIAFCIGYVARKIDTALRNTPVIAL